MSLFDTNPFDELCNEKIQIRHNSGQVSGPFKATFGKNKFTIFVADIDVTERDTVERSLPNGKIETYDITEVHYTPSFHDIPAHVELTARKQGLPPIASGSRVTNISINNSQGFQVGDHNLQNIAHAFNQVIERIEKANVPEIQKIEAKSRLKAFLEHPLTSAIIGGVAGGIMGNLK